MWPNNADIWVSYSMKWSGAMPTNWTNLTEFHNDRESGESSGKTGPFVMIIDHGKVRLQTLAGSRSKTTSKVSSVDRYSMPLFPKDTWTNIVVRMKLNPSGNGSLTFWVNGVQKYNSGPIPMGYNDVEGPYFKYGIYRGASSLTTQVQYANVEVGRTSLLNRVSNPKQLAN